MQRAMTSHEVEPSLRLDIWLYRTRLLKTRSLAAKFIEKGKVRLTRHDHTSRIRKAHTSVRAGDALAFMRGTQLINVTVTAIPERRGPAPEARTHYTLIEPAQTDALSPPPVDKRR